MAKSGSRRKPDKTTPAHRANIAGSTQGQPVETSRGAASGISIPAHPAAAYLSPVPLEVPPAGSLQKLLFLAMALVVIAWLAFLGWMAMRGPAAARLNNSAAARPNISAAAPTQPADAN